MPFAQNVFLQNAKSQIRELQKNTPRSLDNNSRLEIQFWLHVMMIYGDSMVKAIDSRKQNRAGAYALAVIILCLDLVPSSETVFRGEIDAMNLTILSQYPGANDAALITAGTFFHQNNRQQWVDRALANVRFREEMRLLSSTPRS